MLVDYYSVIINVTTFFALIFLWVLGGFSFFFFNFHFFIYFEKVIYVKTKSTNSLETIYSYSKITSKST
jgi:hypothetical protein